jgi:hypothetical protein
VLLALYSGFVAARSVGAAVPLHGALWGAVTGPVWAVLLVILNGLANKAEQTPIWGLGDGGGAFGFALLIGCVVGALGGLLAGQAGATATPQQAGRG